MWRARSKARIDGLLSAKRVSSFTVLLSAYREAGIPLHSAIDGGAGAGHTAKAMLPYLDGSVFAFEPFPGNHRFFEDCDPRIRLIPKALADERKAMAFHVPSVVDADSEWGRKGLAGYSSMGRLVPERQAGDLTVECVRADAEVTDPISFVKLDLQGGELDALKGMTGLLPEVSLMWVEYTGQPGLLDYLIEGFKVFDTEHVLLGEPGDQTIFEVTRTNQALSTGRPAWSGFRRTPWEPYEAKFRRYRKRLLLTMTDLACVNRARLDEFERALRFLGA